MGTRAKGLTALFAVTALVAGCGGSSAPDVSGSPASDSATLFKAANFSKVLNQAQGKLAGSAVTTLKIEPRDVKIVGQSKTLTVDSSGNSLVVNTPSIPGSTFALSAVSPATVEKVVNTVESKAGVKQSGIHHVTATVDPISNKPLYGVYLVSGSSHYQADINGGNVKSYGGASSVSSSGTSSGGAATSSSSASAAASKAQSTANCIAKAGTDAAKIAACAGH
jgi:hypothetical protein